CEQRAGEQHEAVRVLVVRAVGGRHQVQYVAADLPQGAAAPQDVAVRALDAQVDVEPADGVETEVVVEQTDERADGARGVVVLGPGQQQGAASFDVAEVDVVAERRAAHPAARVTTRTASGSGLFHTEAPSTPTSAPVPTADRTGALVNTSGSGPIPTSRYRDHRPSETSRSFARAA